jgi:predicted metal-dependent HD superfamily phosphohydrolase
VELTAWFHDAVYEIGSDADLSVLGSEPLRYRARRAATSPRRSPHSLADCLPRKERG